MADELSDLLIMLHAECAFDNEAKIYITDIHINTKILKSLAENTLTSALVRFDFSKLLFIQLFTSVAQATTENKGSSQFLQALMTCTPGCH